LVSFSDVRLTIAKRDLESLGREKTIVLALLIQLFIAAFSSFLVVGLTSLYSPGAAAAGQVEVGVTGGASDALVEASLEHDAVEPVRYPSEAAALSGFSNGQVDAVVTAERLQGTLSVEATAPAESLRTTLIVVQLRRVLSTLERQERMDRGDDLDAAVVQLPQRIDASPYYGFTYTVLIPLLLFLPPFISGSVAVDALTEEMERETLELLRVGPVTMFDIVDGKALAMTLLAPAQALLWIVLLGANNIAVANPLLLLVHVTALTGVVVVIGLGLGLTTGRRRQAQLLYSLLVILLFGSAVFLPEHPATTAAKLAIDSPTPMTYVAVAGYILFAIVAYLGLRRYVGTIDPEAY
jgi:ABC-2 type transport system permease protein